MSLDGISPGDDVAILPSCDSSPREALGIGAVAFIDQLIVRLKDDRVYSKRNRSGLTFRSRGFIELATDLHREWAEMEV